MRITSTLRPLTDEKSGGGCIFWCTMAMSYAELQVNCDALLMIQAQQQVGFEATILSGRVRREDGLFGLSFDHRVLMVHLDKDYVVDVGLEDSARRLLPLSGDR
ncbi:arylamine N-acetyltransferase [Alicyclobacillus suci]|uniref:arylamine N-acetyltransferase n=1 Tax=Alicyclobacillus suci TaxID=2816080 RepID=UPI001A8E1611|nr:arylamine N-acetyltransferase [Alicyclobacillus suci]